MFIPYVSMHWNALALNLCKIHLSLFNKNTFCRLQTPVANLTLILFIVGTTSFISKISFKSFYSKFAETVWVVFIFCFPIIFNFLSTSKINFLPLKRLSKQIVQILLSLSFVKRNITLWEGGRGEILLLFAIFSY